MNRLLIALLALVAAPLASAGAPAAATRPDVLFIAVDDLNDYITPLDAHPGVRTPNLERLARRSVTFANAHCAAPACHPSRVAVMTGVHPVRSGLYVNLFGAHGPRWRDESPVLRDAVVLSAHFRAHGYRAAGGGKIFHALQWTPGDSQNDPAAWDEYFRDPLDPISADWPRPALVPDATAGLTPGRPLGDRQLFGAAPLDVPDEETGDHRVVDWARGILARPPEQPLFLAVGLFRPHIPWEVPRRWFDLHPLESIVLPRHREDDLADAHDHGRTAWHRWVVENRQWARFVQGYLASVSYLDHQVGRLLDALDATPRGARTIVVLWSDHGFHLGEKANWEKFALWDQTTRVPLFIRAPGVGGEGTRTRAPVTLTDLYPTLCELAGLPVPAQCDGRSLVPQLRDPAAPRARPALTAHVFRGEPGPSQAVADERYRLIRYGNGFEEFYDLRLDPDEFDNRAKDPALAGERARLAAFFAAQPAVSVGIPASSPHSLRPAGKARKKER